MKIMIELISFAKFLIFSSKLCLTNKYFGKLAYLISFSLNNKALHYNSFTYSNQKPEHLIECIVYMYQPLLQVKLNTEIKILLMLYL